MRAFTIRDPLWDTIRLEEPATTIVDSAAFQRLRYIRQLGLAHLIYPGATHTRFDHALGVHHLANRALAELRQRGALSRVAEEDCRAVPIALLLHDIGHYPFSHALEELESDRIPGHHEAVVGHFLADPDVACGLRQLGDDAAARVELLIRGRSDSPLQGLVSGSLDLDKIEYLKRDARFCGVPYGEVDVDRLLHALLLLEDPESGRLEVGVHEKGVAALESLLFAKYQMFRNVYWHHAVRAATVMYKRIIDDALGAALLLPQELIGQTDEGILHLVAERARSSSSPLAAHVADTVDELRRRRLPKRTAEVVGSDVPPDADAAWLATDNPLKRAVEERLAEELELAPGSVYLDYPEKPLMFALDLLLQRRSGEVIRLGPAGRSGLIGLPRVADELYRSARVLRLFNTGKRREVNASALTSLVSLSPESLRQRLEAREPLLRA